MVFRQSAIHTNFAQPLCDAKVKLTASSWSYRRNRIWDFWVPFWCLRFADFYSMLCMYIYLQMHTYAEYMPAHQWLILRLTFRLCFTGQGVLAIPPDICGLLTIVATFKHVLYCFEVFKRNHRIQKGRRTCVAIKSVCLLHSCLGAKEKFWMACLGCPRSKIPAR